MNILGFDTSSQILCIAINKNNKGPIIGFNKCVGKKLTQLLIPTIKTLLSKAQLSLEDLEAFIIGRGPGSFTGLRIGFSTFFGLNFGLKKPVIGLSSLDIIAENIVELEPKYICVIRDARRGLLYSCIYKNTDSGIKKITRYLLIEPTSLSRMLPDDCFILGDGLKLYRDKFKNFNLIDEQYWYPQPKAIIDLGMHTINKYGLPVFNKKVLPLYLYPKECQIRK